jgi:hypothetical protein
MAFTNRQWRIIFGTVNAICAFALVQPTVQAYPWVMLVLGATVAGLGYLRAPDDPAI